MAEVYLCLYLCPSEAGYSMAVARNIKQQTGNVTAEEALESGRHLATRSSLQGCHERAVIDRFSRQFADAWTSFDNLFA